MKKHTCTLRALFLTVVAVIALLLSPLTAQTPPPATNAIAYVPGHYLIPFGGVVYTHTQPANVAPSPNGLVWTMLVFDTAGVYQGAMVLQWGVNTDLPLPAQDYDGDGYDDPAVFRASARAILVKRSSCPNNQGFWGCEYTLTVPAAPATAAPPK